MKFDGILFDLDGTLWDAAAEIAASWDEAVNEKGLSRAEVMAEPYKNRALTAADLRTMCGKPMDAIASILFGDYSGKQALSDFCFVYENEYLKTRPGKVYPGMRETLEQLSERVPLFVVSNCQCGYIEVFLAATGLTGLFRDHVCFGDTRRQKGDNIRLMCEKYGLRAPVYVGDTQGDADAARHAGVPFIHARYGYGVVESPAFTIEKPEELLAFA